MSTDDHRPTPTSDAQKVLMLEGVDGESDDDGEAEDGSAMRLRCFRLIPRTGIWKFRGLLGGVERWRGMTAT